MQYRLDWEWKGPKHGQMYITNLTRSGQEIPEEQLHRPKGAVDKATSVTVVAATFKNGLYKARGLIGREISRWIVKNKDKGKEFWLPLWEDFSDCASGLWRHVTSNPEEEDAKFTQ